MKHTSFYNDAERWTKNAARTVWKNMTYDNALKAVTVAAAVPAIASSAGVVGPGRCRDSGGEWSAGRFRTCDRPLGRRHYCAKSPASGRRGKQIN